jgi:hypothetical protein
VDPESIRQLERNLSHYFHTMQERGQNCKVDCYRRNDLDYFFAYSDLAFSSASGMMRCRNSSFSPQER